MQRLKLGRSDLEVSAMCLGTDLFGSKRDEATCYELLDYFLERGGSFVDTSNLYAAWLPGWTPSSRKRASPAPVSESI
jgi:aryl-alcohol dehydrogenase-like predicted oxidoreductase